MIAWPEILVEDLARRRVIVLLGSGVSRHSSDKLGNRPPTWRGFLENGIAKCDGKVRHIQKAVTSGRYLEACEWLRKKLDENWTGFLHEQFLNPKFKSAPIHQLIYQLDARIVLTPNFDRIYDNYAMSESEGTMLVKKHTDEDSVDAVRRGQRVVLKAHGSIDDANNLIFSAADYASARTKYSNFYGLLEALTLTNPVLMIGAGLDDPDFQLLFENHTARFKSNVPHYMVSADAISDDALQTLRETRNIKVLKYRSNENHKQLVDSLSALVKRVEEKRDYISRVRDW